MPDEFYSYFKKEGKADEFIENLDKDLKINVIPTLKGTNTLFCNMHLGHDGTRVTMLIDWNKGLSTVKDQFEQIAKKLSGFAKLERNPDREFPEDHIKTEIINLVNNMEDPVTLI